MIFFNAKSAKAAQSSRRVLSIPLRSSPDLCVLCVYYIVMRIIYRLYLISILWRFEKKDMTENEISYLVIEESISIHKRLGAGLLERVYQEALFYALRKRGLHVTKEIMVPIVMDDIQIDCAYRIDILVENKVVIEIKSVDSLNDLHLAQTLTYLRLGGFKLGLLLNFNSVVLRSGIKRLVNNL